MPLGIVRLQDQLCFLSEDDDDLQQHLLLSASSGSCVYFLYADLFLEVLVPV